MGGEGRARSGLGGWWVTGGTMANYIAKSSSSLRLKAKAALNSKFLSIT